MIVETIRGQEIGLSCGRPMMVAVKSLVLPLKPVIKKASEEEQNIYLQHIEKKQKAL